MKPDGDRLRGFMGSFAGLGAVWGVNRGLQFACVLLLGRVLTKEDMGTVALFLIVDRLAATFGSCGQPVAAVRFFSARSVSDFRWRRYLARTLAWCSVLALCIVMPVGARYGFDLRIIAALCVAAVAGIAARLYGTLYRASQRFTASAAMSEGHVGIWALCVLLYVAVRNTPSTAAGPIVLFTLASVVVGGVAYLAASRSFPQGSEPVPLAVNWEGGIFLVSSLTYFGLAQADRLFLGGMLERPDLATYVVVATFTLPLEFGARMLNYVLVPMFLRGNTPPRSALAVVVGLSTLAVMAAYVMAGPFLLHVLYSGKYDAGASLVAPFAAVGAVRILNAFPTSKLIALSNRPTMILFVASGVVLLGAHCVTMYVSIMAFGIQGAVVATLGIWILRTAVTGTIVRWRVKGQGVPTGAA